MTALMDLTNLPPTLDLLEAAHILGVGRTLAYEMVRDETWPTPVIRVGRRIRIPTRPLLTMLGIIGPADQVSGSRS